MDFEFEEMLPELGVKAMEVGKGGEEEEALTLRRKVLYDSIDGCTCYSHEDCKNSPGCGNYCSWGVIVGFCRTYELHEV